MQTVNVREAREKISQLLDAVANGEEVMIFRHGKPVAKLVQPLAFSPFPDRSALRAGMPPAATSAAEVVRTLRDEDDA
ncbi:MAG: type II toxin-antitoxin system prevent-host-death family antitoxin [Sulfuricella sp.]|nr:type II toxin-antitoxin system prevent-host-death family antitoxin [Sulfuricella sp.]